MIFCLANPRILALAFLFVFMNAYAEEIFTQHFTVDDGLPSSEAYDVIQDKKGYIWFATNRGVSRYNGQSFTKFTTVDRKSVV